MTMAIRMLACSGKIFSIFFFFLTFPTHFQYPVPLTPYFQESLFVQLWKRTRAAPGNTNAKGFCFLSDFPFSLLFLRFFLYLIRLLSSLPAWLRLCNFLFKRSPFSLLSHIINFQQFFLQSGNTTYFYIYWDLFISFIPFHERLLWFSY